MTTYHSKKGKWRMQKKPKKKSLIIEIDGVKYPVVKETKYNLIIQYTEKERMLFNKRKKRLVTSGWDMKQPIKKSEKVYRTRQYVSLEQEELVKEVRRIRNNRKQLTYADIATLADVPLNAVNNFFAYCPVKAEFLEKIKVWINENG